MLPEVSVIIPHFNRCRLLEETILSVKKQTYPNWEIIVVDDGSSHEEVEHLKSIKAPNIKIFYRDALPKGPSKCRNIGLNYAQGEYVLFLDSDDLLAPWCLEERLKEFRNHVAYDFLVFPSIDFEKCPGDKRTIWNELFTDEDDLIRFLSGHAPWGVCSPIWKKNFVNKIDGFNINLIYGDDAELHLRALLEGAVYKKIRSLPDCFIRRSSQNGMVENGDAMMYRGKWLREAMLLLQKKNKKGYERLWLRQYFKEAEWRMLTRRYWDMKPLVAFLIKSDLLSQTTRNLMCFYFYLGERLIKSNYFLFRVHRRIFRVVLSRWFEKTKELVLENDKYQMLIKQLKPDPYYCSQNGQGEFLNNEKG